MAVSNEIQGMTEGILSSFEAGIGAVELLIEKGLGTLDEYQRGQVAIREDLRERLASAGNLRRKDFDVLVEKILAFQAHRERDLKELVRTFLAAQKALAGRLKKSLQSGILDEGGRCKQEIAQMTEQARTNVLMFQLEQDHIRVTFQELQAQKDGISVRHFRQVIGDLEKTLIGG